MQALNECIGFIKGKRYISINYMFMTMDTKWRTIIIYSREMSIRKAHFLGSETVHKWYTRMNLSIGGTLKGCHL